MYQNQIMSTGNPILDLFNVISGIASMPGYIEDPQKRDQIIIDSLKPYGFKYVGSGQNRVVVEHPNLPEVVYKLAHKSFGQHDNVGEFALSMGAFAPIRNLIAPVTIPIEQRDVRNVNVNGGLLIEQVKVASVKDIVVAKHGQQNLGYNAIKFIIENYAAYKDLISKLSKYVFIFDAHPSEPFNFGVANESLIDLDFGYFIAWNAVPRSVFDGVGLVCEKCHGHLTYHIPNIYGMTVDKAFEVLTSPASADATEKYVCTNQRCGAVYTSGELHSKITAAIRNGY